MRVREDRRVSNDQAPSELTRAIVDIDRHLDEAGWDQPLRLYSLVETQDLLAREPQLAASGLGVDAAPGALTPIEQEDLPDVELDELLAGIEWPPAVLGVAVSHEVLTADPNDTHQLASEIRLTVGVLRDGQRACAIRKRGSSEVLVGADLAPNLSSALAETLT